MSDNAAMSIWFRNYTLEEVNARGKGTMVEHVGIEVVEIGDDFIKATMPVDSRTIQPRGLLHGGANVVLAESLASMAGNFVLDPALEFGVGLEINANHISSCTEGQVLGTARMLHRGRTTQIWEILIHQGDRLVCVSRMTLAVLKVRK